MNNISKTNRYLLSYKLQGQSEKIKKKLPITLVMLNIKQCLKCKVMITVFLFFLSLRCTKRMLKFKRNNPIYITKRVGKAYIYAYIFS